MTVTLGAVFLTMLVNMDPIGMSPLFCRKLDAFHLSKGLAAQRPLRW